MIEHIDDALDCSNLDTTISQREGVRLEEQHDLHDR